MAFALEIESGMAKGRARTTDRLKDCTATVDPMSLRLLMCDKKKNITIALTRCSMIGKFAKQGRITLKCPSKDQNFLISSKPSNTIALVEGITKAIRQATGGCDENRGSPPKKKISNQISPDSRQRGPLEEVTNHTPPKAKSSNSLLAPRGGGRNLAFETPKKGSLLTPSKKTLGRTPKGMVTPSTQSSLNSGQLEALRKVLEGDSLLITGGAGVGKSFLLQALIRALQRQKKPMAVTASTSLAACHINGTSLHRFAGMERVH
eukprot:GHVL01005334.1.p1 GENE.GHVL01005334.1~~GHVL01005334.1.p1  ORF type:complete len:263 (+),score=43.65 GHVL01005334.1:354-1142(+)